MTPSSSIVLDEDLRGKVDAIVTTLTAFVLILGLQQDRADQLFQSVYFPSVESWSDPHRKIVDVLLKREHWLGAFRSIESKLSRFPDDLEVTVELTEWEGTSPAHGTGTGSRGTVQFNLRRLAEYQAKIDEFEKQRKELEKQGKRMVWKVPPIRFERLIYHELTHVLQAGYDAPEWFLEGMASWVGDDPNYLHAFAVAGKKVEEIDVALAESDDAYGRGMIFFRWLESRVRKSGIQKLAKTCLTERQPWKEALESVTGLPWEDLKRSEQSWSAKRMDGYGPKEK